MKDDEHNPNNLHPQSGYAYEGPTPRKQQEDPTNVSSSPAIQEDPLLFTAQWFLEEGVKHANGRLGLDEIRSLCYSHIAWELAEGIMEQGDVREVQALLLNPPTEPWKIEDIQNWMDAFCVDEEDPTDVQFVRETLTKVIHDLVDSELDDHKEDPK